jgi:hypothetical protein
MPASAWYREKTSLGYKSRNAVSNIEVGIEGLPAKRAYA